MKDEQKKQLKSLGWPLNPLRKHYWATMLLLATAMWTAIIAQRSFWFGLVLFAIYFVALDLIVQGFFRWRDGK